MRSGKLFLWDIRFQSKYGFHFLYAILTVIYVIVLFAVPGSWKEKAVAIAVIFFMCISLKISGCPPPVFRTKPRAVSHVPIWIS